MTTFSLKSKLMQMLSTRLIGRMSSSLMNPSGQLAPALQQLLNKLKKRTLQFDNIWEKSLEPISPRTAAFFTVDQQMLRLHQVFLRKRISTDFWWVEHHSNLNLL